MDSLCSIPAFYSGKSVFITGATGFLGKSLIEKLLRSCPDIKEIFLLMRPKKDVNIEERLRKLLTNPLFHTLRREQPHCFDKLIPVKGDIAIENLDLSDTDRNMLIQKTSVIFHIAANVRFDITLRMSVLQNVKATRDICILGEHMKNLVALVYVSTVYSQLDKHVIDEIVYPAEVDWKKMIQVVETLDEQLLEVFKSKYTGCMPNSYVFSKKLAEQVIVDYSESLPCVILRPSIVVATLSEPVKGWMDNFNGPVALFIGVGKGLLKLIYADKNIQNNFVPVDTFSKSAIVASWKCGVRKTLMALQRKIFINNCILAHFTLNNWDIRNESAISLSDEILNDQQEFEYGTVLSEGVNVITYFEDCIIGAKTHLLNERMDHLDKAKSQFNRMYWIDIIVKASFVIFFIWIIYKNTV
ncbi:fatty acyl-CoA reductase 1-like [Harpegnathos saltator]|uniref:fatty acyl-CoA reductase 1-like n=2 Tax=Harpegnathos saltator TaxID=610380 RepID=UPI000DBEE5E7|nr:fatty acyl-CoA reductase 1-like [Harpegnathos saltator]